MSFFIENTTKSQRKELVKKALVISASGSDVPTKNTLKLAKEYINGHIGLKEMQKMVIDKYKRN